jgi:SH3 domain protein
MTIFRSALALLALVATVTATAQETVYVNDKLFVPIRTGAGGDYRIIHKGIPSGTAITQFQLSEDGDWAEIETRGGTRGWMRAQFLQPEPPAIVLLKQLEQELAEVEADRDRMRASLSATASDAYEAGDAAKALQTELATVKAQLAEVTRVSGAALELDAQNRALATELETQRSESDLLRLENLRLQERVDNNQMTDGAIAVLLGVIIAIVAPRLLPRRRRSDGWA